jgi:endonuclease G, mitochondrial
VNYRLALLIYSLLLLLIFQQSAGQELKYLPKIKEGVLVQHGYFSLSYVHKYKDAEWVAYKLTDDMIKGDAVRHNNFGIDPSVPGGTAGPDDYPGKDYDRGHLCPADDMSFSQSATDTSFYMSNMTPQMGSFNRGVWKRLETHVRTWVKKFKEMYVVSGPILNTGLQRIGPRKDISVPMEFFKVILVNTKTAQKMIAFIVPHKKSSASLASFAVPVDSVEKRTGIDFFAKLPNKLQRELEKAVVLDGWDGIN